MEQDTSSNTVAANTPPPESKRLTLSISDVELHNMAKYLHHLGVLAGGSAKERRHLLQAMSAAGSEACRTMMRFHSQMGNESPLADRIEECKNHVERLAAIRGRGGVDEMRRGFSTMMRLVGAGIMAHSAPPAPVVVAVDDPLDGDDPLVPATDNGDDT